MKKRSRRGRLPLFLAVVIAIAGVVAGAVAFRVAHSELGAKTTAKSDAGHHTAFRHPAFRHAVLFGMSSGAFIHLTSAEQASELAKMKSTGIRAVRFDANWNYVEHAGPGIFNWTQLDQEVHSARAAGMSVDLVIDGCPRWAALSKVPGYTAPQPASAAQYAAWAKAVVSRYAPSGVRIYEIWNEPNDAKYWQPTPNPAFYTQMLIKSYNAIKRVDRSAFVVAGGLAPIFGGHGGYSAIAFLKAAYADGAQGHFDALGDHPYTFPALPGTFEYSSAWTQMSETSPSIRSIMAQHGDGDKPIWITEFGAPSNGPRGIGERGQAAELTEAIALAKSTKWIGALFIYVWQDQGSDPTTDADWFGLFDYQGQPKPAYEAVVAAIRRR